jgi:hypothetical protein
MIFSSALEVELTAAVLCCAHADRAVEAKNKNTSTIQIFLLIIMIFPPFLYVS